MVGGSTWEFGGGALTHYPEGDPYGETDGYPGSLFGAGHDDDHMVSEVSIPAPAISAAKDLDELPVARILQPFSDVSDGLIELVPGANDHKLRGLTYLRPQVAQSTAKLHWSVSSDGSERGYLGWSELDLTDLQAEGLWRMVPADTPELHQMGAGYYLFEIPQDWADRHLGGRYLASGGKAQGGAIDSGVGPSLFASAPWSSGDPPLSGSDIAATVLIHYPDDRHCWDSDSCDHPQYPACDEWSGGAWLAAGSKSAVLIVGSKGRGEAYPGEAGPQDCDEGQDCRCSSYQGQFLFYSPDELAAVAEGEKRPWDVLPYAKLNADQYLWPGCSHRLGGAAFDRDRGIVYVLQRFADRWSQPLVHVFKVVDGNPPDAFRVSVTNVGAGSGTVSSDLPGIDCGSDCEELYPRGEVVRLFAKPGPRNTFVAWDGDADCLDGILTVDADRSCTAVFQPEHYPISVSTARSSVTAATRSIDCGIGCQRALQQALNLQWDPVGDDARIVGYEVHYGLASRQYDWTLDAIDRGAATDSATLGGLEQGSTYYIAVRSRNSDRSLVSAFSNEICLTVGESAAAVNFSADVVSGEAPLSVAFAAQAPACTDNWLWDFGDGSTSNEPQPTHVYRSAGSFTVSLAVSGPGVGQTAIETDYIAVSAGSPTVPSDAGLVAAYGFDEPGDNLAFDASGNANDGVLSGPVRTSDGQFGSALAFDGLDDWLTVADHATLDLSNGMTLEAWVKPSALSGWRTVLLKEAAGGLAYALYAHDNAPRPAAYINTGGGDLPAPGAAVLATGSWSHLVTTYDGARLRLFVNGVEAASTAASGPLVQSGDPLRIGGNGVWGEYFSGLIDEVRVYNRALSSAEIQADMAAPVNAGGAVAPDSFPLDISKTGTGSGTVTSSPSGIDCGSDCQQTYPAGALVQLTATPEAGSSFGGWGGSADCNDGSLTMDAGRGCTATFTLDAAPPVADPCVAYEQSPLYRARSRQVTADPTDWLQKIEGAAPGDEILLADGVYDLRQYAVVITDSVTVRSASGNRDAVLVRGQGYAVPSEGFMIQAPNVTLADLTITGMRNHGISVKGELGADAPHMYNVHVYDIGTQHIKGTAFSNAGIVACSRIGYSPGAVSGDYLNGIDIHGGVDWTVRDNELYNIWGDGTGCNVDSDCGTYTAGGGPAILFWNGAGGTLIERNRIVDCFRGIALGFGTPHPGGVVRNNFVVQSASGDAGIQIDGGAGTQVDHNTVILGGSYPGAVEIWNSTNLLVRNNLLSQPIWNRGNTTYAAEGNKSDATLADLAGPNDPHLSSASSAIDLVPDGGPVPVSVDIDGDTRPQGTGLDAGADEYTQCVSLSLPAQILDTPATFACQNIAAMSGFQIAAPGNVVFQATDTIVLGSGFRVAPNATFKAVIGP
jgi:PKD repeat protein